MTSIGGFPRARIVDWLATEDRAVVEALFRDADRVRREEMGDGVHLRGLIEISNVCGKECLYCGLRRSNAGVERYKMSADDIVEAAREAHGLGYRSVVIQSGESGGYTVGEMADVVARIKKSTGLAITLSLGEKPRAFYAAWKDAGADRYLLRFETSDPWLFGHLKPDGSMENRLRCLADLKELGYQVGSGVMVGLPGQSVETLADDIALMDRLQLDMIGVGPFIPNPETPLGGQKGGSLDLTLRVVAVLRLVTRVAHIPATTAMGSIDPRGREKALECGANVLMPNVTPRTHREHYRLYPGKICLDEDPSTCAACLRMRLDALGRTVDATPGHSLRSA
ncbi:MAG: [FeFe] hydrogenase H-cluster radical SAM maturase HydE [Elusimicrobia bacterium]|nr:[FeFe] hydrogenase H-cluster radical SAM maturase HydE [Elusimicrobiota bacterium]